MKHNSKIAKRCKECGRVIRQNNKSRYCWLCGARKRCRDRKYVLVSNGGVCRRRWRSGKDKK
jgi:hypothetical protein